ncbi:MAG TPA: tripartite tricarboxylate transporter substrate-binding protein, partial [Burkholderiales bacterium]|nr:tripartite tricarboxylate transporter substrate-binding protein [Burkholderiales bacterium]
MKSFSIPWVSACYSGIGVLAAIHGPVYAQTPAAGPGPAYPAKLVRMIAPFPPGGSSDLIARIVAQKLSEGFPNQVIIENRPGAGSNLGSQIAARAAPDGYTLLITSVTAAINVSLFR